MGRGLPEVKILQAEWHRNGVGGVGFYAILFEEKDEGRMVAALYDEPRYCSVFRVADLSDDAKGVLFGINSWRGDVYEDALRPALKTWIAQHATGRIGPFSIPRLDRTP